MTKGLIAVTGTTGYPGGRIARQLSEYGTPLRLVVRDKTRAPKLPGADAYEADYFDGAATEAALSGIETLFMVSGNEFRDRLKIHREVIEAATRAGVQRVVCTSFLGLSADALFTASHDHYRTERHLAVSGLQWTALRNAFMPRSPKR